MAYVCRHVARDEHVALSVVVVKHVQLVGHCLCAKKVHKNGAIYFKYNSQLARESIYAFQSTSYRVRKVMGSV